MAFFIFVGKMRTLSPLLFVLIALVCVQQASGLFFYLKEGQKKCFIEDLPRDTVVVASVAGYDLRADAVVPGAANEYTRRKNADTEPLSIIAEITLGKKVVSEHTLGDEGRFAFTSQDSGEHSICFKTSSTRWFGAGAIVSFHLFSFAIFSFSFFPSLFLTET